MKIAFKSDSKGKTVLPNASVSNAYNLSALNSISKVNRCIDSWNKYWEFSKNKVLATYDNSCLISQNSETLQYKIYSKYNTNICSCPELRFCASQIDNENVDMVTVGSKANWIFWINKITLCPTILPRNKLGLSWCKNREGCQFSGQIRAPLWHFSYANFSFPIHQTVNCSNNIKSCIQDFLKAIFLKNYVCYLKAIL